MGNDTMGTYYDAVIIGAGMGGLSCGTLLAKEGLRVLICEQSSKPGGYCQNFKRNGFTFTPAVHFLNEFGPNGQMKEAFQTLGLPPEIEFYPQDPQRRIITPHFHLILSTDIDRFERDLIQLFPRERLSIPAYIEDLLISSASKKSFSYYIRVYERYHKYSGIVAKRAGKSWTPFSKTRS
jgi:phytoene dehydrogenase-like protein